MPDTIWGDEVFGSPLWGGQGRAVLPVDPESPRIPRLTVRSLLPGRVHVTFPRPLPAADEYRLNQWVTTLPRSVDQGDTVLTFTSPNLRTEFVSERLSTGSYYFTLFARNGADWSVLGTGNTWVVGEDHEWREGIFKLLSQANRTLDESNGFTLKRYLELFEHQLGYVSSKLDALRNLYSLNGVPGVLLRELSHDYGVPYVGGLGGGAPTRMLKSAPYTLNLKGTVPGAEAMVSALTGFTSTIMPTADLDAVVVYLEPSRINYVINPSFETNLSGWLGSYEDTEFPEQDTARTTGASVYSSGQYGAELSEVVLLTSESGDVIVTESGDPTWPGDPIWPWAHSDLVLRTFAQDITVSKRESTLTASAYVASETPGAEISLTFKATTTYGETTTHDGAQIISGTGTMRPFVSLAIPPNFAYGNLYIKANKVLSGHKVFVDAVMIEGGLGVRSYFDGDSSPVNDYKWASSPHYSWSAAHPHKDLKEARLNEVFPAHVAHGQDYVFVYNEAPEYSAPVAFYTVPEAGQTRVWLNYSYDDTAVRPAYARPTESRVWRQRKVPAYAPVDEHPGYVWRERQMVGVASPAPGVGNSSVLDTAPNAADYDYRIQTLFADGIYYWSPWLSERESPYPATYPEVYP